MERELNPQIKTLSSVMRTLLQSVVVKKELSLKAKLWIYWSVYIPTLNCGLEVWLRNNRIRSWIQAAKLVFLQRVGGGLSLRDRVRSSIIRG